MSGKSLTALFTALLLAGSSGCQLGAGGSATGFLSGRGEGRGAEELSPEFREAQKTFRRNTPKALLSWARYQEDVGEYAEALRRYRELTIAYPENIEAHLGLARVENTTGRFEQAEEILKNLAASHPENTQVLLELGQLYSQREDWNAATVAYERACRISPHDQICRYELGVAMARNGLMEQALPHLTFAVGGPAAHYNVGYLLHEQGRDGEAAEWLRQALAMHPDQKTADQSRRLLSQLDASADVSADASEQVLRAERVNADRTRQVRQAVARLAETEEADVDEAEAGTGVQQASWSEEEPEQRPVESRLKQVRIKAHAGEDAEPSATDVRDSGRPAAAVAAPQEPPVWRTPRSVTK